MRYRLVVATIALGTLSSCSSESGSSASAPAHIAVVAGDAQLADVGDGIARPLQFEVTDAQGRPVSGVAVTFAVTAGDGTVPDARKTTDANGIVETPWTMGSQGGVQLLQASITPALIAVASASICLPGECYPEDRLDGSLTDATLLTLATYDSSGQAMHPDVVHGQGAVHGFWLAATPYPGGEIAKENPSIFRSDNAGTWEVPAGATNPLATPNAFTGYNSDPDIVFNPTDQQLWMYYRAYSPTENVISVLRSADGSHWDHGTQVLTVPAHQIVSPTIVRGALHAPWTMWAVNAGPQGCSATSTTVERRTSTDGLSWTGATVTDLAQPGQVIWHIDVEWIPARSEYWAIYNTYPTGGSCSTHSLYLARSSDGLHWTVSPSPIARSGLTADFADIIYRTSFLVNSKATRITLWISGARYVDGAGYVWRTAVVSTKTSDLLAIAAAPASTYHAMPYRPLPPPEQ